MSVSAFSLIMDVPSLASNRSTHTLRIVVLVINALTVAKGAIIFMQGSVYHRLYKYMVRNPSF